MVWQIRYCGCPRRKPLTRPISVPSCTIKQKRERMPDMKSKIVSVSICTCTVCIFTVLWIHKLSFSYAVEQLKDVHLVEQLHHHLAHRARTKAIYRFRVSKRGNTIQLVLVV